MLNGWQLTGIDQINFSHGWNWKIIYCISFREFAKYLSHRNDILVDRLKRSIEALRYTIWKEWLCQCLYNNVWSNNKNWVMWFAYAPLFNSEWPQINLRRGCICIHVNENIYNGIYYSHFFLQKQISLGVKIVNLHHNRVIMKWSTCIIVY